MSDAATTAATTPLSARRAIVIKAPTPVVKQGPMVFLAGSIEMGRADDWQERITDRLGHLPITILNPRRDGWNPDWDQSTDNPEFVAQVNWELDGLRDSDVIAMYFDKDTKSPITLLELGLFADTTKLVVYCPKGYWRKGNVDMVCIRHGIKTVTDFEKLVEEVTERLSSTDPEASRE